MKHRQKGRHLGRNTKQRRALYQGLITQLVFHESITTTLAKAKTIKPLVEKLVTKAKTKDLASRRLISSEINDKKAVNKLINDISPRFSKRPGGYLRTIQLGNRTGDNAPLARLEFIPVTSLPLGKSLTPSAKPQPKTTTKPPAKHQPPQKKSSSGKNSQSSKST